MSAVGFDLFAQMLNQAVADAREGEGVVKGAESRAASDININIPGKMFISNDYVPDLNERVLWYRRVTNAGSEEAIEALERDMRRVHPDMPPEAESFFAKERLRAFAEERGATSIVVSGGNLNVEGLQMTREQLIPLKRKGGRYLQDRRKLIMPLKKIAGGAEGAGEELALKIGAFLHEVFDQQDDED